MKGSAKFAFGRGFLLCEICHVSSCRLHSHIKRSILRRNMNVVSMIKPIETRWMKQEVSYVTIQTFKPR